VFLAHDQKLNCKVAIKVLKPELASSVGPERFQREIKDTAQFSHPHIVPLLDSGKAQDLHYYLILINRIAARHSG
jgi:serine/threonine-protein kinase